MLDVEHRAALQQNTKALLSDLAHSVVSPQIDHAEHRPRGITAMLRCFTGRLITLTAPAAWGNLGMGPAVTAVLMLQRSIYGGWRAGEGIQGHEQPRLALLYL